MALGASPADDRQLCGWRLRSAVPMPELPPWTGDGRSADIAIDLGMLPAPDPGDIRFRGEDGDVDNDGRLWIDLPGIGRFRVAGGRAVTIEPWTDLASPWIRGQLYSTVLATICGSHGILPMHGSCVVVGGRAHLFLGDKGAGKSSLAAILTRRGHRLMTDDLCPVSRDEPTCPLVLPGVPRLRLGPDMIDRFGIGSAAAGTLDWIAGKYLIPVPDQAQDVPAALAAIHHLAPDQIARSPWLEPISGLELVIRLRRQIHRWELARALGHAPVMFRGIADLAAAVPHYRLWRGGTLAGIDAMADLVEAWRPEPA